MELRRSDDVIVPELSEVKSELSAGAQIYYAHPFYSSTNNPYGMIE